MSSTMRGWSVLACAGGVLVGMSAEAEIMDRLGAMSTVTEWPAAEGGNGHFYQWVEAPLGISWTDASEAAGLLGGHLVTLTSAAENDFVFSLIEGVPTLWQTQVFADGPGVTFGPWIGAYQDPAAAEPDDGWGWVTGEIWDYTNWRDGEPNQVNESLGVEEDFGQFIARGPEPGPFWNDRQDGPFDGVLGEGFGVQVTGFVVEYVPTPGTAVPLALAGLSATRRRR